MTYSYRSKNNSKKNHVFVIILSILVITLSMGIETSEATSTLHVPSDYSTIQAAINAAQDNDRILVDDGTYRENIDVNKPVTIESVNGYQTTEIYGNYYDHILNVQSDNVTITGLKLRGATQYPYAGIYSENTNLTINNCYFTNNNYGIHLKNTDNNNISNITIEARRSGINLEYSDNNQITNTTVTESYQYGVSLSNSQNNLLTNITGLNNNYGIHLYRSPYNNITDSQFTDNNYGINLDYNSDNLTLTNSQFNDNTYGYQVQNAAYSLLRNNTWSNDEYSIFINSHSQNDNTHDIDTSNQVNGKPVYYYLNKQDMTVPLDAGYIGIVDCTNMTVRDLNMTKNGQGVFLAYSTNCIIQNFTATNNYYGINLVNSDNNTVTNSTIYSNENGVYLKSDSRLNNIQDNLNIHSNSKGLYLDNAHENQITNITTSNNQYGLYLSYSESNILRNVTTLDDTYSLHTYGSNVNHYIQDIDTSNTVNGRPIYYLVNQSSTHVPLDAGLVAIVNSTKMTIRDLSLSRNGQSVLLAYSDNCTVENTTLDSDFNGIHLYQSKNNTINNITATNNEKAIYLEKESNENTVQTDINLSNNNYGIYLQNYCNNNTITDITLSNNNYGIYLYYHCNNNTVANNVTLTDNNRGIEIYQCYFNTFENITATSNMYGLYSRYSEGNIYSDWTTNLDSYGFYFHYGSHFNTIKNSNLTDCSSRAINFYGSHNNTINDNNITGGASYGIYLWDSDYNDIYDSNISKVIYGIQNYMGSNYNNLTNLKITDCTYGLYQRDTTNTILRNTSLESNEYGVWIQGYNQEHYVHDIDSSNHVNDKPIYYLVNQNGDTVPSDAGFIGLAGSTNITVRDVNITKNRHGILLAYSDSCNLDNVTLAENYIGIHLIQSTLNNITDAKLIENHDGIFLESTSNNNTVSESNFTSNTYTGYRSQHSDYNRITGTNFTSTNIYAIYIEYSSENIIENSDFTDNNYGAYLYQADDNTITGSNFTENNNGCYLRYSDTNTISQTNYTGITSYSIHLQSSANNQLLDLNITDSGRGAYLSDSNDNTVSGTNFTGNTYGVYLYDSDNNRLCLNYLDNVYNIVSDSTNIWNTTTPITYSYQGNSYTNYSGNWWSDYSGEDTDNDGIGDTPYTYYNEIDYYPRLVDNYIPETHDTTITNLDDTDNVYAGRTYTVRVNASDQDGADEISKIYLRGVKDGTTLFQLNLDGEIFSIASGSEAIHLNTTASERTDTGTNVSAVFNITPKWNCGSYADCELDVYVEDSKGDTYDWTNIQTNYFDIINRLVTEELETNSTRVNTGSPTWISGKIYYANTTDGSISSELYPSDDEFTDIQIHDITHQTVGSDSDIVDGVFNITLTLPQLVQNNTYHVYLNMADGTQTDAADGDTVSIVSDRVYVNNTEVSDERTNVGDNVNVNWTLKYEYDDTPVVDGTISIENTLAAHLGSGIWQIAPSQSNVMAVTYNEFTVEGNSLDITATNMNGETHTVIWDRIYCTDITISDHRTNIGESETIDCTLKYEYNDEIYDSGNVTIEGKNATHQGSGIWRITDSEPSVTRNIYNMFTVTGDPHNITEPNINGQSDAIIWDQAVIYYEEIDDQRVNINNNIEYRVKAVLDYDETSLGIGDTVSANHGPMTWDSANAWFDGTHSLSTVGDYDFDITSINTADYGITTYTVNSTTPTGIWDRVYCSSTTASDNHVNINENVDINYTLQYEYDNTPYSTGTVTIEDNTATHQGNGVWQITENNSTVTAKTYDEFTIINGTYGITGVNQDLQSEQVIWDRIKVTSTNVSDSRVNIGEPVNVNWTLVYEYDDTPVVDGTVSIEGIPATHLDSGTWQIAETNNIVTKKTFDEFTSTGNIYDITTINLNNATSEAIWDQIEVTGYTANATSPRNDETVSIKTHLIYDYDNENVTDGQVYINGSQATHHGQGWWKITEVNESVTHTYNHVTTTGNSHGITIVNQNNEEITITWNSPFIPGPIPVVYYLDKASTSTSRAGTGDSVTVSYHMINQMGYDAPGISLTIDGVEKTTDRNGWANFSVTSDSVGDTTYNPSIDPGDSNARVNKRVDPPTVIWDKIKVHSSGASNPSAEVNESVTVWFKARHMYDDLSIAPDNGNVQGDEVSLTWSENSQRWEGTVSSNTPTTITISVSEINDSKYGVTSVDLSKQVEVTWVESEPVQNETDPNTPDPSDDQDDDDDDKDNEPSTGPDTSTDPLITPYLRLDALDASTRDEYVIRITGELGYPSGESVGHATMKMYAQRPGSDTWIAIATMEADSRGVCQKNWMTEETGIFNIKVTYDGDTSLDLKPVSRKLSVVVEPTEDDYVFASTNSTIEEITRTKSGNQINFRVTGVDGTKGFMDITIFKNMTSSLDYVTVLFDGEETDYTSIEYEDRWILTIWYTHSSHTIDVVIDEPQTNGFDNLWTLFILAMILLIVFGYYIMKRRKDEKTYFYEETSEEPKY